MSLITKEAPAFKCDAVMPDGSFKELSNADYKGKYLVVLFYPLDFTFVCPTEILAFSDRSSEFEAINASVVAVSVDSKFSHLAWQKTARNQGGIGNLNIPILSDIKKEMSSSYGVLHEDAGIALRGLFIISDKGVVRSCTINDFPVGRSVDETLRLVQAFQFTDKHGEVCPANWKAGSLTIKPEVDASKEYFEAANKESDSSKGTKKRSHGS